MRRITNVTNKLLIVNILLLGIITLPSQTIFAETTNAPSLIISQIKITSSNGQFVSLYNASNAALDMSKYQLAYFNSYDVSKATSSRIITLSGSLPPHSYYVVSDAVMMVCYQTMFLSTSLGFSSTAGFLEVVYNTQASPGAAIQKSTQDSVGWSKTPATGAQTLPSSTAMFLGRTPLDATNNPAISIAGGGGWQILQNDPTNPCVIQVANTGNTIIQYAALLPSSQPPIQDAQTSNEVTTSSQNEGLMAVAINELLPNPIGTGNDSTSEFIELYNPNTQPFDLSNYTLIAGIKTQHRYSFPNESSIPPQSFTPFYATTTKLSMSNVSGQVTLLNPSGDIVAKSDPYTTASDGQSWVLADNHWQWSTKPTPALANIVISPVKTKSKSTTLSTAKRTTISKPTLVSSASNSQLQKDESKSPIHVWMLALVAIAALLYGAYEFRSDIGNRIYQFRRYIANRRGYWFQTKGR